MAEDNASSPAADPSAPSEERAQPPAPTAPGRTTLFPLIGAVVGLFILGFAGSWIFSRGGSDPSPSSKENGISAKMSAARKHPALLKTKQIDVKQAESYLRQGNHATALTYFEAMASEAKGRAPAWIQFRIGLCREALGQWEKAASAFQSAGAETDLAAVRLAAQLAQGRVFLKMGRATQAKNLLLPLVLQAAVIDPSEYAFLAEIHYLYALALAQTSAPREDLSSGGVRSSGLRLGSTELPLRWPALLPPREQVLTVQAKPGVPRQEWPVQAIAPAAAVAQTLERMALLDDVKIDWSPAARKRADNRTITLAVEGWPWIDLVETLAESVNLICTVGAKTIQLRAAEDISKEALASHRRALVQRALQVVAFQFPAHSLTPVTYLEMGNYKVDGGHLAEAATWYERIVKEFPQSHLTAEAHYNLGALYRRMGDQDQARRRFYAVVDQAPGHPAVPAAYWQIGLSHLEDGKPTEAARPLRQALGFGVASPHRPSIILTAAGAHLAAAEPLAAHQLILQYRMSLKEAPFRQMGAFLDCYALYLIGVQAKTARREQEHLVATLLEVRDDAGLGPFGQHLIARAYYDLKMFDQAAQVCEKNLARMQGAWANEMLFLLAEANMGRLKLAEATKLFTDLSAKDKSRWAAPAQLKLAQMALGENRAQDCLEACQKLWAEQPPGVDRSAILQVMGEAFERLGDLPQAARCYAGQPPE